MKLTGILRVSLHDGSDPLVIIPYIIVPEIAFCTDHRCLKGSHTLSLEIDRTIQHPAIPVSVEKQCCRVSFHFQVQSKPVIRGA